VLGVEHGQMLVHDDFQQPTPFPGAAASDPIKECAAFAVVFAVERSELHLQSYKLVCV